MRQQQQQKPLQQVIRRTTPVLTLALIKLDENLDKFCRLLADPTYKNVQLACELLDSTIATASSPAGSERNSPRIFGGSSSPVVAVGRHRYLLSPHGSLDNHHQLLMVVVVVVITDSYYSNHHHHTGTSSAVALEGEFEKFSSPLIIFAALEGMYSALAHAESDDVAKQLCRMYGRTRDDLQLVRETLCDPFLHSGSGTNEDTNTSSSATTTTTTTSSSSVVLASYKEKAELLANTLASISSSK